MIVNIDVERIEDLLNLFGDFDTNIKQINKQFNVLVTQHGSTIKINGEPEDVLKAQRVLQTLLASVSSGEQITDQSLSYAITLVNENKEKLISEITNAEFICLTSRGKPVKPKTIGQKKYIESITHNTITVGIGPAGTGKTHLAVAMAVRAFRNKEVNKIILTRPAVEAGESLGFLTGDLQQKVDPYLRPLYDALFEMLGAETFQKCQERGDIEVAPLAYMRGRTLDDSFIILDEAQNTTAEQMKMFLTRLGFHSKAVVTGDITQIDLPSGKSSGLKQATQILRDIDGIEIIELSDRDIVRHHLVQKIIKAYEKFESRGNTIEKCKD